MDELTLGLFFHLLGALLLLGFGLWLVHLGGFGYGAGQGTASSCLSATRRRAAWHPGL
jgi:hypothetical protein